MSTETGSASMPEAIAGRRMPDPVPSSRGRLWAALVLSLGVHGTALGIAVAAMVPRSRATLSPMLVVLDEVRPALTPARAASETPLRQRSLAQRRTAVVPLGARTADSTAPGVNAGAGMSTPPPVLAEAKTPSNPATSAPTPATPRPAVIPEPVGLPSQATVAASPSLVAERAAPPVKPVQQEDSTAPSASVAPLPVQSTPQEKMATTSPRSTPMPGVPAGSATSPTIAPPVVSTSRPLAEVRGVERPLPTPGPGIGTTESPSRAPSGSTATLAGPSTPVAGSGPAGDTGRAPSEKGETLVPAGAAPSSGGISVTDGGGVQGRSGRTGESNRGSPVATSGSPGVGTQTARTVPAEVRRPPPVASGPVAPTAEHDSYLRALQREIQDLLRYPPSARRRNIIGTVLLEVILHPTGDIEQVVLRKSSSHDVLDRAALDAVRSLRPRPFPPDVPRQVLRWHFDVVFDLRFERR